MGDVRVAAIDTSRRNDLDRRGMGTQIPNLNRGGMRSQDDAWLDVKRIMHSPRGVVRWNIQCFEVVVIVLDFWTFGNIKAQATKNLVDSSNSATHGVKAPGPCPPTRERNIDPPTRQRSVLLQSIKLVELRWSLVSHPTHPVEHRLSNGA